MASNRRKQDEKHLKILRELVSKPANRTCFDCNQKGPTYINMTIGSFVCTSCSGILWVWVVDLSYKILRLIIFEAIIDKGFVVWIVSFNIHFMGIKFKVIFVVYVSTGI